MGENLEGEVRGIELEKVVRKIGLIPNNFNESAPFQVVADLFSEEHYMKSDKCYNSILDNIKKDYGVEF